jgi:hypothetical protein
MQRFSALTQEDDGKMVDGLVLASSGRSCAIDACTLMRVDSTTRQIVWSSPYRADTGLSSLQVDLRYQSATRSLIVVRHDEAGDVTIARYPVGP